MKYRSWQATAIHSSAALLSTTRCPPGSDLLKSGSMRNNFAHRPQEIGEALSRCWYGIVTLPQRLSDRSRADRRSLELHLAVQRAAALQRLCCAAGGAVGPCAHRFGHATLSFARETPEPHQFAARRVDLRVVAPPLSRVGGRRRLRCVLFATAAARPVAWWARTASPRASGPLTSPKSASSDTLADDSASKLCVGTIFQN